ncbi:MAG: hypothetical protein AAGH15_12920 [Myxococcota bacterium]
MMRAVSVVLALACFAPALAVAQASRVDVIVLGIRSLEGDDEVARNLTGALRNEASSVPTWRVDDADISLAQMSLVHGCAEPDAACMAEIALELGAARIVYGTLRRTGADDARPDFALTLYLYDAEAEQIVESLTDTIPNIHQDIDDLRTRSRRYVAELAGTSRFGALRLVTRPRATVLIDGSNVGTTDESGVLVVEDLTEGERQVEIDADDHALFLGRVTIVADEETELRPQLVVDDERNLRWIPGAAVLAGGAVFFGLGIRSWRIVRGYDDERDDVAGRSEDDIALLRMQLLEGNAIDPATGMPEGPVDPALAGLTPYQAMLVLAEQTQAVCDDGTFMVEGGRSACDEQDRNRRLQWVFHGLGLASVGVGTWLLVRGLKKRRPDAAARLSLEPSFAFGRRGGEGGLRARLVF